MSKRLDSLIFAGSIRSHRGPCFVAFQEPGLYALAAHDIFAKLDKEAMKDSSSELGVWVSLFEIYRGKLYDLLNNREIVRCLEDARSKVRQARLLGGAEVGEGEGAGDRSPMVVDAADLNST